MKSARSGVDILEREAIEARTYWAKRLPEKIEESNLILDFVRPPFYSGELGRVEFRIENVTFAKLNKLTGNGPFLLYTTLMAALKVCLYKYTGNKSIVVGSPPLNEGNESLTDPNALAIIDEINDDLTFRQLLMNVRGTLTEAYANQNYLFSQLLKDRGIHDLGNKCPLFDVALVLKEIHADMPELKNDITITFSKGDADITGVIEFNKDLFRLQSIESFAKHYHHLLSAALETKDATIADLQMLMPTERHQVLVLYNQTRTDYPREATIAELFQQQALLTPQAVALSYDGLHLTYEQLRLRSNRLAHYLIRRGVCAEHLVGVCLDRGIDAVVAMLAILKAGGAYVPLDPDYPVERLRFMVEDSGMRLMISRSGVVEQLPQRVEVINLDQRSEEIEQESEQEVGKRSEADNLAYVMYTSGSTGRPKGISIPQRGVVRLVKETRYVELNDREVMLQYAPISFDASTFEIWGALLNGGRLEVMRGGRMSVEELMDEVERRGVTTMWLTAGLFHEVARGDLRKLRGVRQMLAGGDVLGVKEVERVVKELRGIRMINGYGPTEATTFTCSQEVREVEEGERRIAIGKPISNTQVYILGERMEVKAVGVVGELYIGGEGLARCYRGDAEQTAERFVPNPYGERGGERVYRSGDEVRYRWNGEIEFVGRRDEQVKIRGYRVEMGEIEEALKEQAGVRESAVVVKEDSRGEKRLVGYVVMGEGEEATAIEIRRKLSERLPDYMVPRMVVRLEQMPLTENGKVDRKALREGGGVEDAIAEMEPEYEEPRGAVEEVVAGIWGELLEVDKVSRRGNFFEMGGHSLLATRVISRIRESLKVELGVGSLFDSPTVEGLSLEVERMMREGECEPTPLSYAQQKLMGDEPQQEEASAVIERMDSDKEPSGYNENILAGSGRKMITPMQPVTADADTEQILTELDRLSNEQVDALLDDMLTEAQDNK